MGNGRDAMSEDNAAKVAETTATPGGPTATPGGPTAAPVEAPKRKLFRGSSPWPPSLRSPWEASSPGGTRRASTPTTRSCAPTSSRFPPRSAGRVVEVIAKENAHVANGDVLLRLDATEYELKVAQAEGERWRPRSADARRAHESAAATRSDIQAGTAPAEDARARSSSARRSSHPAARRCSPTSTVPRARATVSAQSVSTAQVGLSARTSPRSRPPRRACPRHRPRSRSPSRDLALAEIRAPQDGTTSRMSICRRASSCSAASRSSRLSPTSATSSRTSRRRISTGLRSGTPVKIEVDAYPDPDLEGTVESIVARHGRRVLAAPARQRDRELHQGRPARAGADRARRRHVDPRRLVCHGRIQGGAPEPHVAGATR